MMEPHEFGVWPEAVVDLVCQGGAVLVRAEAHQWAVSILSRDIKWTNHKGGPWRGSGPCCPSPGRSCSRLPLQASRRSRDKNWWSCRPELLVHLLHLRTNIREGFKNSSSIDYWNCPLSGRVGYRWSTKENDMTNDIRKVGGVEVSQWTFSY